MPDPMQQSDDQEEPFKVDLVAPDIYSSGYRDFQRLCQVSGAFVQEPGEGGTGWATAGYRSTQDAGSGQNLPAPR